jgi:hypothetical protein
VSQPLEVKMMSKQERRRFKRLQRRCDWLEARIAIAEANGRRVDYDVGELSALRWALERITMSPDDLWAECRVLQRKIANQRKVIRNLVAYQHRIALDDDELDALVDAAVLGDEGGRDDHGC